MNSKKGGNASEDEIEHINNGNDFEIEDIGTFDEPEKSKPSEKSKSTEKSTSKSSEKVDSESDEEVEIVKDSPSEAFWFLEDGIVKSSKDVPSQGSKSRIADLRHYSKNHKKFRIFNRNFFIKIETFGFSRNKVRGPPKRIFWDFEPSEVILRMMRALDLNLIALLVVFIIKSMLIHMKDEWPLR